MPAKKRGEAQQEEGAAEDQPRGRRGGGDSEAGAVELAQKLNTEARVI